MQRFLEELWIQQDKAWCLQRTECLSLWGGSTWQATTDVTIYMCDIDSVIVISEKAANTGKEAGAQSGLKPTPPLSNWAALHASSVGSAHEKNYFTHEIAQFLKM